jgi:hypothetical protein
MALFGGLCCVCFCGGVAVGVGGGVRLVLRLVVAVVFGGCFFAVGLNRW